MRNAFPILCAALALVVSATGQTADYKAFGVQAVAEFDRLPYLRGGQILMQESSHDPTGANLDGCCGHFRYDENGENVMADLVGPGVIYRFWTTGYEGGDDIIFTFDDAETPKLDIPILDFFSGARTYLPAPLTVNNAVSSGGFTSYTPIPFQGRLKISTTGDSYYNLTWMKYEPGTPVGNWSFSQDLGPLTTMWNNVGEDPKTDASYSYDSVTTDLGAMSVATLYDRSDGARTIGAFRLRLPDLDYGSAPTPITDDGKAFSGYSEFTMAVDSTADTVTLVRRLDYGIADQRANVFVDDTLVGEWSTPGSNNVDQWLDAEFDIPSSFVEGKDEITIKVDFVSSAYDWNEFYYWIYCDGVLADELDVGDATSESAHGYTITSQTWSGEKDFTYPPSDEDALRSEALLKDVWVRATWDGAAEPQVLAPLGLFFGIGTIAPGEYYSLPLGADADGELYSYFPAPYNSSATIELVNQSGYDFTNITARFDSEPFTDDFEKVGYFKVRYNEAEPATLGRDFTILESEGTGHYVGVVLDCYEGGIAYLEGDERIHVDDARTPFIYGTGMEDYFNGGWYFQGGEFDLQTHGMIAQRGSNLTMYRHHFADPVVYQKNVNVGIEHGGVNDHQTNMYSAAFYYERENLHFRMTDELDVGDAASEAAHNYVVTSSQFNGSETEKFEGDDDDVAVTEDGRRHTGTSEFTVDIEKWNNGVRVLRMFNYTYPHQQAKVYVDDEYVGLWYSAGRNSVKRWREEYFLIPSEFTFGKDSVRLKFESFQSQYGWSECRYRVYSIGGADSTSGVKKREAPTPTSFALEANYPNPFNPVTTIRYRIPDASRVSLTVFDALGREVATLVDRRQEPGAYETTFDAAGLASGVYLYRLRAGAFVETRKMTVVK
jgi:hypothetical protein